MRDEIRKRIDEVRCGWVPEGYKKEYPYTIPEDWNVERLGTLSECISRPNRDGKERPVYSVNNQRGFVPQSEQFDDGSYQNLDKSAYKIVKRGEFAYNPARVNVGSIGLLRSEEEVIVSSLYVCVKTNEKLDTGYFDCWTASQDFQREIVRNLEGSVRDYLFYENFSNIRLPIPPVAEQKKIVEILTANNRAIEQKQVLVEELQSLKKTCLAKMFPREGVDVPELRFPGFTAPWEQRKLGDISDSYSGGTPTAGKAEYYGGSIPFIRSAEVNSDITELFLTDEGLKNSSAKMVNKGDILYALYGATSGEVGLARLDGAINQAILDIKPHEDFDASFIMQWLRKSKASIIGTYLQGGQGNLSGTIVTSLMIDCPNYVEQKRIGDYFGQLDNLITLHQRELEAEQQKKKALMQLLLTGLVRVNQSTSA